MCSPINYNDMYGMVRMKIENDNIINIVKRPTIKCIIHGPGSPFLTYEFKNEILLRNCFLCHLDFIKKHLKHYDVEPM